MVAQPVAQMECLRAPRVRLFAAVVVATKKVRVCYQTAVWQPAEVPHTVYVFYGFCLFMPIKSASTNQNGKKTSPLTDFFVTILAVKKL